MKNIKGIKKQRLNLRENAVVFVDWANVYGWKKELKAEPSPDKIYKYLKSYKEIKDVNFYYGTDLHLKSKLFLKKVKTIGYKVKTKSVKYIFIKKVKGEVVTIRKCDFDIEIVMDVYRCLERGAESFVFLSGDGDFEPLYKYLIKLDKQVIVIYEEGHLGKEIWQMGKGLFKTKLRFLGKFTKNNPRTYELNLPGRDWKHYKKKL